MTQIADMKMALLAVLIAVTAMMCGRDGGQMVEVEPVLRNAPLVETHVLTG